MMSMVLRVNVNVCYMFASQWENMKLTHVNTSFLHGLTFLAGFGSGRCVCKWLVLVKRTSARMIL